ncbi:MAG: PEGA domain-containing protein [Acidobacteriota bacterium]
MGRWLGLGLVAAACLVLLPAAVNARQGVGDVMYQEARRLFEGLDYENAVKALDQVIAAYLAVPPTTPEGRERLATAYEMRARSKFGLGNPEEARADFIALLRVNPNFTLTGQVSPRVVSLFEETAAVTVANLALSVTPSTAIVTVDGVPIETDGPTRVTAGDHVIAAEQRGYRSAQQAITANPGETATVILTLERLSAVISILTSPADVDVLVDGVKVGRTGAGPPPQEYAEALTRSGASTANVSSPLILDDVKPGEHTVEFTRPCFVRTVNRLVVERPDDYLVGPVTLKPAVATVSVTSNEPGTQVFIDGQQRGVAPYTASDVCEGSHLIELRSRFGSDSRRIDARAGDTVSVEGALKPMFALVSATGESASADVDMRVMVERALSQAQTVRVLATPSEQTAKVLKTNQLPTSWLAADAEGRPQGAAMQMTRPARTDASSKLADAFGAQGVASVTAIDKTRMVISLLAAGSGTPEIVELRLDRPDTIAEAVGTLDRVPTLSRPAIGVLAIDVTDLAGPVVVGVDATSPANGRVSVGDIVVTADGQPTPDVAALLRIVAGKGAGSVLAVELRDAKGASKRAELSVFLTPRLMGLSDQTLLANRVLMDLRARLAAATDPFQQSVIRLNTAVALARLGDYSAAQSELRQVKLPDGPGVGNGTVQYLYGVCAQELGNRSEALGALKAAAASEALLTEDGPAVRELAEARLAQLQRSGGGY